jgi:hypothetical protein
MIETSEPSNADRRFGCVVAEMFTRGARARRPDRQSRRLSLELRAVTRNQQQPGDDYLTELASRDSHLTHVSIVDAVTPGGRVGLAMVKLVAIRTLSLTPDQRGIGSHAVTSTHCAMT